jgi:hypothetical protein
MANNRTFYACQAVAIQRLEPNGGGGWDPVGNYEFVHGVQSVGINSNFEVETIFELGQLEIYDTTIQVPSIEVTMEKVLDNHPTPYTLIVDGVSLLEGSKNRANVKFAIYKDTENAGVSAGLVEINCTGMYLNSISYTVPVDGNATESATLTGNHGTWSAGSTITIPADISDDDPDTADEPSGGKVLRRADATVTAPQGASRLQSVTISADLGREDLFQLGQQAPYFKAPNFPIEVTAELEYLATEDNVDAVDVDDAATAPPIENASISIAIGDYDIDLGAKCFIKSVQFGGGDAGGGNATVQYSYATYNTLDVTV